MPSTSRESLFILGCALLLAGAAGCASAPAGPPVEAPRLVVGDHWQYRVVDQLRRGAVSTLDLEVISAAAETARIRVDYDDGTTRGEWVDEIDARGGLRAGILQRELLEQGKTWRQTIETFRKDLELTDHIQIYGQVGERRMITVPAGGYDGIYVYRILRLDDAEFWRTRTTRRDAIWYAAEVKAPVREAREAEYTEIGGPDVATVRTESTVRELVSFRPGAR